MNLLFITTLLLIKSYSKGTFRRAIIFLNLQIVKTDFGACILMKPTKIVQFWPRRKCTKKCNYKMFLACNMRHI